MNSVWSDIRHAVRGIVHKPGFAVVVIATLALGIGANAAIFSVVDALVLRPFPIPDIDRMVMLFETAPNSDWDRHGASPANFLDWQEQSREVETFDAYEWWDVNVTGAEQPERLQGTLATPGFLDRLGVTPHLGRTLALDRDDFGARTAVISYALWSRRYASDPGVVETNIILNGESYDIVGVAEEDFNYPMGTDVWSPLWFDAETRAIRSSRYLTVIGRLREGATTEDARAELDLIAERLGEEYPNTNQGRGINTMAMGRAVVDIGAPAFLYLWQATSVFVLLIACVNVANLLLARGADRKKEISLQLALGARRGRVVRQLLTETIVLSLLAAAVALPLAGAGVELLRSSLPAHIQRFVVGWDQIDLDWHVLGFTAAVALITALIFGLAPALHASRLNLSSALREGGRSDAHGHGRGRSLLVVLEVALALALLVASGLSIQGTLRMANEDQGYDADQLMTMELVLPESRYEADEKRSQFYREVVTEIRRIPSVVAADAVNILPSSGSNTTRSVEIEGQPAEVLTDRPTAHFRVVSDSYFQTMRIPLVSGRAIEPRDRKDAPRVAVVSERFAARSWSGEEPVGKRFRYGSEPDAPWLTVVGVSGDVLHDWFLGEPQPTFYVPLDQAPRLGMFLAVRTAGAPEQVMTAVRAQVAHADPNQPLFNVQTMRTKVSERIIGLKFAASIMGIFGIIALVLSTVGVYGVMAYSVSRRTHEIGLRVALGAEKRDVLGLTVGHALRVTALGIALGSVFAFMIGQAMVSMLFGVIRLDAFTFIGIAAILAAIALLASYIPARRALGIDPAIALRVD